MPILLLFLFILFILLIIHLKIFFFLLIHSKVNNKVSTVNVLKFCAPKFLIKWPKQTVQNQIRLLLKGQSQIRVYAVYHSTKCIKKQLHKKQNLGKEKKME